MKLKKLLFALLAASMTVGSAWADNGVTPVSFNWGANGGNTSGTISFNGLNNVAGSITAGGGYESSYPRYNYWIELAGSTSCMNYGYRLMKFEWSVPSYTKAHVTIPTLAIHLYNYAYATESVACLSALYEFDSQSEAQSASVSTEPSAISAYASGTAVPYSSHLIRYAYNSGAKQAVAANSGGSYTTVFDNSTNSTDNTMDKYWLYTTCSAKGTRKQTSYMLLYPNSAGEYYTVKYDYYKRISFDANGGTGSMAEQTVVNSGILPDNTFANQCHTFLGWNTKADGTGIAYVPGDTITATSSDKGTMTLYAQWKDSHNYANPVFNWSGTSTCSATFTCSVCNFEQTEACVVDSSKIATTCTVDGVDTYWATATHPCDTVTFSDTCVVTSPATGHVFTNHPDKDECDVCHHTIMYYTTNDQKKLNFSTDSEIRTKVLYNTYDVETHLGTLEFKGTLTSLCESAFYDCENLVSISIPNSITEIEDDAFNGCESLSQISLKNTIKSIGDMAFFQCGFTSIVLPNSITSISAKLFAGCGSLEDVTIPSSVTSIGEFTFYSCENFKKITIPFNVTNIGRYAFNGCDNLYTVTNLAPKPQTIEENVFTLQDTLHVLPGCGNAYRSADVWKDFKVILEDAEIPYDMIFYTTNDENVVSLSSYADFGAKVLSNTYQNGMGAICFDGDVTRIPNNVFCQDTISLMLPNSVTKIDGNAFSYSTFNSELNIPNSVTYIGSNAFSDCTFNSELNIPNSVTYIGSDAFSECNFKGDVNISNGITEIGEDVFWNSTFNGNLNIPNSVTKIDENAFSYCTFNSELNIPNSVTKIDQGAFSDCTFNSELNIPNSVTYIGYCAFAYCNFKGDVNISKGITEIGDIVFQNSTFNGNLNIPNSVTRIGVCAFRNCTFNSELNIPNSVTYIDDGAFKNCTFKYPIKLYSLPELSFDSFDDDETIYLSLSDSSYVYTESNEYLPALASAPTYSRTGIKNTWGTVVVPFALSLDGTEPYDLYIVSGIEAGALSLTKTTELAAGTPALIRMSAAAKNAETGLYDLTMTAVNTSVNVTGSLTDGGHDGLTLKGTYSPLNVTDNSGYIISRDAFWNIQSLHSQYPNSKIGVGAFRAYLSGSLASDAAQLRIGFDEEPAGETELEVLEALTSGQAEFYDINGRRQEDLCQGVNIIRHGNKSVKVIIK